MPEISRFYGIVITMYWSDHPRPHFHAEYAGERAGIEIGSGQVLSGRLPRRALRLTRVEPQKPYWLRLWFEDGSIHEVDVGATLEALKGVVDVHTDPDRFATVRVEPRFGTIEWPGGLDLDPDVLHGDYEPESGRSYPRRIIRGPDPDGVAN